MDRRKAGLGLMIVGGLIAAYFMLAFSIVAPGTSIVNLGLMNDRTSGLMFGGAMALVGAILFSTAGAAPRPILQHAPPPPIGWTLDPALSCSYPAGPDPIGVPPFASFCAAVRGTGHYTNAQLRWGWTNRIPVAQFPQFIGYLEAYRTWAKTAQIPTGTRSSDVPKWVYWVVVPLALAYLGSQFFKHSRPAEAENENVLTRAEKLSLGETEDQLLATMGRPSESRGAAIPGSSGLEDYWWDSDQDDVRATCEEGRVTAVVFRPANSREEWQPVPGVTFRRPQADN